MEHGRDNGSGAGWERLAAVQGRPVTRPGRVPASFSARLADEADQDEQFWRDRLNRSHLLLAERDGRPQGIASLGPYAAEPRRVRSSGCMSSPRHAVRACPGG